MFADSLYVVSSPAARTKSNLLSLSSEELNVALSRFVREVCRPSGERYSPDSILYLCLGIQQVGTKPENESPETQTPHQQWYKNRSQKRGKEGDK